MKYARYWPMAVGMLGVGLIYVVLAQADSKPPADPIPQPGNIVFENADAPWSPSDLPRLDSIQATICQTAQCATGECLAAGPICPACPTTAQAACPTACQTVATTVCPGECQTACQATCPSACQTTCATSANACLTAASCACGTSCSCSKECACGKTCSCGASTFQVARCSGGECEVNCCENACACPQAGAYAANVVAHAPQCQGAVCHEFNIQDHVFHPGHVMQVWAAPLPPGPGPLPPNFIPSPGYGPPPEVHHGMHDQLVQALVENARLQMQVEFSSQKEEIYQSIVESAVKNATLEAKLEAVQERQELVEHLMEVATEKAKLEAAAEMMQAQHELHAEALEAMLEARQELFGPLHEALVENASLKAQAATHEQTTTLKARIAELEHALGKAHKHVGKSAPPAAETAEKSDEDSETK